MPADDVTQGQRVEGVRMLRRLTRERMAEILGVPRDRVRAWEMNERAMDEVELEAVAYLLTVKRDYFIRGDAGKVVALELLEADLRVRRFERKRRRLPPAPV
jgi:transcriptional regulator with XRE-family HTH domain